MNDTKQVQELRPKQDAAEHADESAYHAIRGSMLSATNLYHAIRLSAVDGKAISLMAIAGLGLGFLAERTSLQAASIPLAVVQILQHPSLLLLFAAIVLAVLALRPVQMKGSDWLSHLTAGAPTRAVVDEFLMQSPQEICRDWIYSQSNLVRIENRKYHLVGVAAWLLVAGFGLATLGA